ncbi:MAG: TRAP transporter permease [Ruminococcaceae bacterium]|nr:TRAP transporter permease [Oscillospiraceae bacterium]
MNLNAMVDEEINADELMAEFDRESNVRLFQGVPKILVKVMLALFVVMVMVLTLFVTPPEQVRRSLFLGYIVFMGFIMYPVRKGKITKFNDVPWYDLVLAAIGLISYLYYVINFEAIINRAINITPIDMIFALCAIVLLIEVCRRVVGLPILCVAGAFIVYAFIRGYSLRRIVHQLFFTTDGVLGTPLGVCATFIVLFIILGSFLEKTGIGTFFIDLANSIAGFASGGPAKVAVISSALEGMYSGSSVANTVGSGSVTIPVMKKTGYRPEFAAAVEAAASTGGQIMPPIMGAAAFLMAEMTNTPYSVIAVAAILPAVLYFAGIFMMIHFEAKKLGLKGLPKESIPNFFKLLFRKGYLFAPIIVLVALMSFGKTPAFAACYAILAAIVTSMFSKETRLTPSTFLEAVEGGARNTIGVAIACAIAGIIVGVVTLTGLGQDLINVLMSVAGTSKFLALFLTMIACIVLGMGVPTTANYVIMATITAPIVVRMGVPVLAAHMFVFYFGIVADITPPVALAAYAGAAIAKSNPLKTGVNATRLAITAFIVPYIFAFNPAMLFIETTPLEVVQIIVTSIIGIFGISAGMEGYMFTRMKWYEIIFVIAGGLMLVYPGLITDVIGIVIIAAIVLLQMFKRRRALAK